MHCCAYGNPATIFLDRMDKPVLEQNHLWCKGLSSIMFLYILVPDIDDNSPLVYWASRLSSTVLRLMRIRVLRRVDAIF